MSAESLARARASAQRFARSARSPRTLDAYASDFEQFAAWCAAHGVRALPAEPSTVGAYLATLADDALKTSTVQRAVAGIVFHHRKAGHELSRKDPAIRDVLAGIARERGTAPAKKAPVVGQDLSALVRTRGQDLRGLRDRAILTLGWAGAFRRSELAALEVCDVTFTPEGMRVDLGHGKGDPEGKGLAKGIPHADDEELCAVRALRAWLNAAGITEGPLFRRVSRSGRVGENAIHVATIVRLVKDAAEAVGLDPEKFAGHSLRSGFATTAAANGRGLDAIQRQLGQKSITATKEYVIQATLFVANAAKGLV